MGCNTLMRINSYGWVWAALSLLVVCGAWQSTAAQTPRTSDTLRPLIEATRAQIELAYRSHPTQRAERQEQLDAAVAAWRAAPQNTANGALMRHWLRGAIRSSMPGSRKPLPALPQFSVEPIAPAITPPVPEETRRTEISTDTKRAVRTPATVTEAANLPEAREQGVVATDAPEVAPQAIEVAKPVPTPAPPSAKAPKHSDELERSLLEWADDDFAPGMEPAPPESSSLTDESASAPEAAATDSDEATSDADDFFGDPADSEAGNDPFLDDPLP